MTTPPLPTLCWGCSRSIDAQDAYCRFCGRGQGEHVAWYYKPWGIAVCTFFGLGPFGLALVWMSPVLSKRAKAVSAGLILLFSLWLARGVMNMIHAVSAALAGAGLPLGV
ncbi:MAG: hypothetical protein WC969_05050 [Elusimicrobiota bacterium]|jgi:hypothetical protein